MACYIPPHLHIEVKKHYSLETLAFGLASAWSVMCPSASSDKPLITKILLLLHSAKILLGEIASLCAHHLYSVGGKRA
ncbi:hypothetical protein VNO80_18796 [Phaseolus coccineus]|uniref:Uncharacterized protein n=1 Tax=Phaseolus coccineus TaxID=3886 RepID=A0AAN9MET2_PHACN